MWHMWKSISGLEEDDFTTVQCVQLYSCTVCTVYTVCTVCTVTTVSRLLPNRKQISTCAHYHLPGSETRIIVSILMNIEGITPLSHQNSDPIFVVVFVSHLYVLEFLFDFSNCMKMRVSVSWCILLSKGTADVLGRWFDVFIITHLKAKIKLKSRFVLNG